MNIKKILILLLSLVLSIAFCGTINYINFGNKYTTFAIEGVPISNSKVLINKINIGGTDYNLKNYENGKNIKYNINNYTLEIDNSENWKISFSASNILETKILFTKVDNSGSINIYKNDKIIDTVNLSSNSHNTYEYQLNKNTNIINIIKSVSQTNLILTILICIIFVPIFYLFLNIIIKVFVSIKEQKLKFLDIIKYITAISFICLTTFHFFLDILNIFIILPIASILLFAVNYLRKNNLNIENLFILIVVPIGIIFGLIMPPFNVPDEYSHTYKGYINSFNNETKEQMIIYDNYNEPKFLPPTSIEKFAIIYGSDLSNRESNFDVKTYFTYIDKINYKNIDNNYVNIKNTLNLSSLAYMPTSIVMFLSRIFNIPVIIAFFCSRILNFSIWAIFGYYSLKIIPKFKKTLFVILLMPIMIQQAIAINQDYLTNAIFIFLVSLIIKEIYQKGIIKNKNILIIVIMSILLAFCKMGYFPAIFLVLLIPKNRFKNNKNMYIKKTLMIIPILLAFIYTYFHSFVGSVDINRFYTIGYLLRRPKEFIYIYFNTLYEKIDYEMFRGLVDGFAFSTKYHSGLISVLIQIIYIIILLSSDETAPKLNIISRLIYLFCSILLICIIFTALLACTPIGDATIAGLQPRYFLPPLLLFIIGISNNYLCLNIKNKNYVYSTLIIISFMMTFFTLISKFYI